jgi:hypothetical protein
MNQWQYSLLNSTLSNRHEIEARAEKPVCRQAGKRQDIFRRDTRFL